MCVRIRLQEFINSKGINISDFERFCGLSNGYVHKIKNSVGKRGLADIQRVFPELNTNWLLTGEGEMFNPSISQSVTGSNNTAVAGNGNLVNTSTLIEELAAQRRLTEKVQMQLDKSQEQIDRLLTLLERK